MFARARCLAALSALLTLPTLAHSPMPRLPASRSGQFHLPVPCSHAMALFTAEGETRWAPGWAPQMLSGDTTRGSVFRTYHGGRATVWVVIDYDPASGRASYARLVEGSNMGWSTCVAPTRAPAVGCR